MAMRLSLVASTIFSLDKLLSPLDQIGIWSHLINFINAQIKFGVTVKVQDPNPEPPCLLLGSLRDKGGNDVNQLIDLRSSPSLVTTKAAGASAEAEMPVTDCKEN